MGWCFILNIHTGLDAKGWMPCEWIKRTTGREGRDTMFKTRSFVNVAACVRFRFHLGARFSEKYHVSHLPISGHCLCPWARHLTLNCFTWLRWKWVPVRTEMAMCMISVKLKWQTNEQVQWPGGKNVKVGWNTWYQTINLHLNLFFTADNRCTSCERPLIGQWSAKNICKEYIDGR